MKHLYIFLAIFVLVLTAKADNYPVGANSLGMANATVAVPSLWSVYHNQAATAFLEGYTAGLYYDTRFGLSQMSTKSLAVAAGIKPGTIGFNFTNFGYSKFSDNKVGVSFAMKLAKNLAAGIQLDYFMIHQEAYYGNLWTVSGEIGVIAKPFNGFTVAAHLFNPWRSKIAGYQNERLPTVLRLGIAYNFTDNFVASAEVQKDLQYPALFKAGFDYEVISGFDLRAGLSFNNKFLYPAFGVGYTYQNITLDIAFDNTPLLGTKTGVGLSYRF